ncbi:MAG: beta-galactosidase [Lentisphaeria bacterium]|nr:beta-galactosidase [Lentisphaeria bacterium]
MKKILICFCIFTGLMLSATPRVLFELGGKTKLRHFAVELTQTDDGTLSVKKNSHANWGGFYLPHTSVLELAGQRVRISGRIQVKSLKSFGLQPPSLNGSIWFQNEKSGIASHKKRIGSGTFFSLKEVGPEIAFDKTFPVPSNGKYMVIFLNFGYSTGEFIVKNLKVEVVSPVKVEKRVNTGIPEKVMLLQPGIPKSFSLANTSDWKKSANITLSYTPEGVHLHVEANDTYHRQPFSDKRIWRGDSLQFAADPLLDRQENGYNGADDVEYGLALLENGKSLLHIFAEPADYPPPMNRIRYFVRRDEAAKKTEYQLFFPWKAFGPFLYDKMDRFGANILLNACEENGQRHTIEWHPATANGKKPAAMAAILLDKTKRGIMADILPCKLNRDSGKDYCFQAAVAAVEPVKGKISITCNGKEVYDENILFAQGETIFSFTLPNTLFQNGENSITISFADAQKEFHTKSFKVSQISEKEQTERIMKLRQACYNKMAALEPMIQKFNTDTAFPREQMISWKVCKLFLDLFIPEDVTRKDYVLALREVEEVDAALTQLKKELESKNYVLSQSRNVMDLKIDNGSLVGSDGPVFAFGIHGAPAMRRLNWHDHKMLSITHTSSDITPIKWTTFPTTSQGKPTTRSCKLRPFEWRNYNTTSTPLIQVYSSWWEKYIKKWQSDAIVSGNHFLGYDPDHPRMREMVDIMVSGTFRDLAAQKHNVLKDSIAFDLWNEPMFGSVSPYTVMAYRNFLEKRYGTIENYNRYYKSNFKNFNEITDIRSKMDYLPIACYDYCTFNNQRFYEFHKIVRDAAKRGAGPENPIRFTIKLMNAQLCGGWASAERGYDVDLISKLTDIHGGDNFVSEILHVEPDYTCNWRPQVFAFDLMKSVAPNQPIIDSEYHASATSPDMVSAAFIMGAHHGLNAASWWRWNRDEKMYFRVAAKGAMPYWFHSSPDCNPAAMIAGLRTAVLLDRLMEEVQPFYTAPRPMRILWSQTSINFIGTNSIQTLWKVYDKVNFTSHQPVGFVTERQLLEGKIPEDMKILVIAGTPYAQNGVWQVLEKLEKAGVRVVRIGKNQITRNSFDKQEAPPRLKHPAEPSLAAWDIRKDMQSTGVTELARLVGENRHFVEARFVKYGKRVLGYAVNVGKQKAKLHVTDLQGKNLAIKTRGEIPVRTMTEFELAPRGWILFEL